MYENNETGSVKGMTSVCILSRIVGVSAGPQDSASYIVGLKFRLLSTLPPVSYVIHASSLPLLYVPSPPPTFLPQAVIYHTALCHPPYLSIRAHGLSDPKGAAVCIRLLPPPPRCRTQPTLPTKLPPVQPGGTWRIEVRLGTQPRLRAG